MLQVNPNLTPIKIREILRQTARVPLFPDGSYADFPNNSLGWGIVDAGAAITMATAIDEPSRLPLESVISTPYPLPASDVVHFDIDVRSPGGIARLDLFDLLGRRVQSLQVQFDGRGTSQLPFKLKDLATGVFAYRLSIGDQSKTGTLVVVR